MAFLIVTSSPDILSGTPVFAGTRVPVQALIDYLEGGETIDDFLRVSRPSSENRSSPSSKKPLPE